MTRDRSKFSKIEMPSLEGFAKWILSNEFKNRKKSPSDLEEAWVFYCYHHERQVINRKNYKYWLDWMEKNKSKAFKLYPCHFFLYFESEGKTDEIPQNAS